MKRTLEIIWIILVVLTVFAYLLGYLKYINESLVAILLFTTFVKGQLVIDYFMDLRTVELKHRLVPTLWLSITISLLGIVYYLPV